jgi:hypothetical protein
MKPGWCSQYSNSLWVGRSGDGNPVGARFSMPINTSPKAHLTSCIMGTRSFSREKWLGHCADHPLFVALRLQMGWIYISSSPLCLYRHVLLWSLPLQQSHMFIIGELIYQVIYCTYSFSTILNPYTYRTLRKVYGQAYD